MSKKKRPEDPSKWTAEKRIAHRTVEIDLQYGGSEEVVYPEDAVDACKEHAAAAVEPWQARVVELERILHDAPTIVEVEEYAPGWLDRLRAALGKEADRG